MSERGYFDLRYALPGFTFLLIFVVLNVVPIFKLIGVTGQGSIFGGILTLLSGSAFGFLISQIWWWQFQKGFLTYNWKPVRELIEKFKLSEDNNPRIKQGVISIYDYVLHSDLHSREKHKGLSSYAFRRWDLYILLSCVRLSIALGIIIGSCFRILSEYTIFNMSIYERLRGGLLSLGGLAEFWLLSFALIAGIALVIFISRGRDWVRNEMETIHHAVIKQSEISRKQLTDVFPEEFFSE